MAHPIFLSLTQLIWMQLKITSGMTGGNSFPKGIYKSIHICCNMKKIIQVTELVTIYNLLNKWSHSAGDNHGMCQLWWVFTNSLCATSSSVVFSSGHTYEDNCRKAGPSHHEVLCKSFCTFSPQDGMSAGLRGPRQCLQFCFGIKLWISLTLRATYCFHGILFLIQQRAGIESDQ